MKRQIMVNGLLSITAVSMMTGCVDNKYDLSDIDTTSRFTVNNLTVPVNLSEIKLENVINLDDNENITTVDGEYAISKAGNIAPTAFSINKVHVNVPSVDPTNLSVNIPGGAGVLVSELDIPAISLPASSKANYQFRMENVDKSLLQLKDVKTEQPIKVEVVLSVPASIAGGDNSVSFRNLQVQLPWGLVGVESVYDQATGVLTLDELAVDSEGKARIEITANGLALNEKGNVEAGTLNIAGEVGIIGGEIKMYVKDTVVPSSIDIRADYSVSSFDIASFSGRINYNMDDVRIDPISLNDLPEFLDNPQTNIVIANPQILVNLQNPVGRWLEGHGNIVLTSNFKNGDSVEHASSDFTLSGNSSALAFCTDKNGYTYVEFDALRDVLSHGNSGLPSSIDVAIRDINFAGEVIDFPLGDLGNAEGNYEFNAPLGFGNGSFLVYETTEDGWSSDDLDKVNIKTIHLKANCTTNLPVQLGLTVVPVDKNGHEIAVDENAGKFEVSANAQNQPVELVIKALNGGTITDFDGMRFRAVVEQNSGNTEALGPDLFINLDQLSVTVDGYYETDF